MPAPHEHWSYSDGHASGKMLAAGDGDDEAKNPGGLAMRFEVCFIPPHVDRASGFWVCCRQIGSRVCVRAIREGLFRFVLIQSPWRGINRVFLVVAWASVANHRK